jgi:hypothetical protein
MVRRETPSWAVFTFDQFSLAEFAKLEVAVPEQSRHAGAPLCLLSGVPRRHLMMAPKKGPNRMNMKFTNSGTKLVIHVVGGLPPKLSGDKKTITIIFPEQPRITAKGARP